MKAFAFLFHSSEKMPGYCLLEVLNVQTREIVVQTLLSREQFEGLYSAGMSCVEKYEQPVSFEDMY